MIICLPPLCKSCLEVSAAVSSSFCSFFSLSSLTVCALVRLLSSHTRNDVSDLLFLVCTFTCSLSLSSLSLSPVESEHTRVTGGNLLAVVIAPADGHEIIMFVFNICQRERERESIWTHSISTAAALAIISAAPFLCSIQRWCWWWLWVLVTPCFKYSPPPPPPQFLSNLYSATTLEGILSPHILTHTQLKSVDKVFPLWFRGWGGGGGGGGGGI